MDGATRLEKNASWHKKASVRLATMYGCDADDAFQILAEHVVKGRSRRICWLKACRELRKQTARLEINVGEAFDGVGENRPSMVGLLGGGCPELVTRAMDLELILDNEEQRLVAHRVSGLSIDEIADELNVTARTVRRRLEAIRHKIVIYYSE